jgi:prolipoprotein diacylglyceryltransferase
MVASIPSPSANGVQLGPFEVRAYGFLYVVALLAAVAITTRRWEARGGSRELVQEVALWGFPAGLIGGRLYYLATSWDQVPDAWWGPLAVWKGGLGIWGGIALGTAVGIWRLRRRGADVPAFLDAAAPGLLVAQAIGRIGNYFNEELFGKPTSLPWGSGSTPRTVPTATRASPPSTPRSSMRSSGTLASPRSSSGSATTGGSGRPGCSPSTSRATRSSASSRAAAHRSGAPHPRAAPQPLPRQRAHGYRRHLVCRKPTRTTRA